jgi:hypothetical protein
MGYESKEIARVPVPGEVRAARVRAGHTQAQAAELVGLGARTRWAEYESGMTSMDAARWTLYLLLSGQHPKLTVVKRTA